MINGTLNATIFEDETLEDEMDSENEKNNMKTEDQTTPVQPSDYLHNQRNGTRFVEEQKNNSLSCSFIFTYKSKHTDKIFQLVHFSNKAKQSLVFDEFNIG